MSLRRTNKKSQSEKTKLNCNGHSPTEDHLEMLYLKNFLSFMTKQTRLTYHTATLIDHICTNSFNQQVISGIATIDISNHLPIFCVTDTSIKF